MCVVSTPHPSFSLREFALETVLSLLRVVRYRILFSIEWYPFWYGSSSKNDRLCVTSGWGWILDVHVNGVWHQNGSICTQVLESLNLFACTYFLSSCLWYWPISTREKSLTVGHLFGKPFVLGKSYQGGYHLIEDKIPYAIQLFEGSIEISKQL